MNKEQELMVDLLVRSAKFMEDNGITFYLYGGSAIGALRHNGFIPWDDDLDIIVTRENFKKIKERFEFIQWDDIDFICVESNPHYFKPSGFFSLKNDVCTSKSRIFYRGPCLGTVMDIFILDDMDSSRREEMEKNMLLYNDVLVDAWVYNNKIIDYLDEYKELKADQLKLGKMPVINRLKHRLESCDPSESDMYLTRWAKEDFLEYDKSIFGEPVYHEFEGHMMPLPTKPEAMLRVEYGYSWYLLPEHQDREQHDFTVNHNISCNNYAKDIDQFVDWDEADRALYDRKLEMIHQKSKKREIVDMERSFMVQALLLRHRGVIQTLEGTSADQYQAFLEGMDPIIRNIKLFKRTDCSDKIPASVVYKTANSLIYAGRYYDAMKMRDMFGFAFEDGEGKAVSDLLDKVLSVVTPYQDKEYPVMKECLDGIPEDFRINIPDFILADIKLNIMNDCGMNESNELIQRCDNYLKIFPDNYDIMKAKGDLYRHLGYQSAAESLYNVVLENSRNGLDVLEIRSILQTQE